MIGGNVEAVLQVKTTTSNEIGESEESWHDVVTIPGWLDLASGDSKYTTYNTKVQESTHLFVGDYMTIPSTITVDDKTVSVTTENTRMMANSKSYDVMLIDDPMEMHKQLEIYLKYTGGR